MSQVPAPRHVEIVHRAISPELTKGESLADLERHSKNFIEGSSELFEYVREAFGLDKTVGFSTNFAINHYFPRVETIRKGSLMGFDDRPAFTRGKVLRESHLNDWVEVNQKLIVRPQFGFGNQFGKLVTYLDSTIASRSDKEEVLAGAFAYACARLVHDDKIYKTSLGGIHLIVNSEIYKQDFSPEFELFIEYLNEQNQRANLTTENFMSKINRYE